MKTYQGTRLPNDVAQVMVWEDDGPPRPLPMRAKLGNYPSKGEFEWGYGGTGPSALALALLADHFAGTPAGDRLARAMHQDFKFFVVASLPRPGWMMTGEQIGQTLCRLAAEDEPRFWGQVVGALDVALFTAAVEESGDAPAPADLQRRATGIIARSFPVSPDYAGRQVAAYYQRHGDGEETPR